MIKGIYDHMKAQGLNPYFPGQHKGECTVPYTVILTGTQIPEPDTHTQGQRIIDILIYHPASSYIGMDAWITKTRDALRNFRPLRPTGTETPVITEDDIKAYSTSIKYTILKELK